LLDFEKNIEGGLGMFEASKVAESSRLTTTKGDYFFQVILLTTFEF
jgi:hypothetical protein